MLLCHFETRTCCPLRDPQSFVDNVHEEIELSPLAVSIIDTRPFQRLRGVHQLGLASLVYLGERQLLDLSHRRCQTGLTPVRN